MIWYLIAGASVIVDSKDFVEACLQPAETLQIWGDRPRRLEQHLSTSAACPSFAQGVGAAALQLMTLEPSVQKALDVLNEGPNTTKWYGGCYEAVSEAVCYVEASKTYSPGVNCSATLERFHSVMSRCHLGDSCPGFDKTSKQLADERLFCQTASIKRQKDGADVTVSFAESEWPDCYAIARDYNVCMDYGTRAFHMADSICTGDGASFKAYCESDLTISATDKRTCVNVVAPAIIWAGDGIEREAFCHDLKGTYLVWLARRRADAELKARGTMKSLASCNRLVRHLNEQYLQPVKDLAVSEKKQLLTFTDVLDELNSALDSQVLALKAEAEASAQADLADKQEKARANGDSEQSIASLHVDPDYLDESTLYLPGDVYDVYREFSYELSLAGPRHQLALTYSPTYDQWHRPTNLMTFIATYKACLDTLALGVRIAQELSAALADSRNVLHYDNITHFSSWSGMTRHQAIEELRQSEWEGLKSEISAVSDHSKKIRTEWREAVQMWETRYCGGREMIERTGAAFASAAQILKIQIELVV